jgi:lipopolysaccharide transport system ATP-binding protein
MGRVTVSGLSKKYRYRRHGSRAQIQAPGDDLRFAFSRKEFWALREIGFEVGPGEMLGLIGPNGAGKSTLLRLLGGVGRPNAGTVQVKGRVGALLELGSDFHPELTGRENVILSGIIAGLTRREVLARMDEIIDFAELRDFIDTPIRTYSSGMLLRLGFSITVNTDPDVLLIDEVLAVGDVSFKTKCLGRIEEFRRRGCAIILVTHDMNAAAQMCDEVIWLHKGRIMRSGPAALVVSAYAESMDWETKRRTPMDWPAELVGSGSELRMMENRFGSMEMRVTDVRLLDAYGHPCRRLHRGERLRVEIDYRSEEPLPAPNFGIIIRQENNTVLFDETTPSSSLGLQTVQGRGSIAIDFDRLDLNSGDYHIDVGVYRHDWAYTYDYHWRAYPLTMLAANEVKGPVNPPHVWERIDKAAAPTG